MHVHVFRNFFGKGKKTVDEKAFFVYHVYIVCAVTHALEITERIMVR